MDLKNVQKKINQFFFNKYSKKYHTNIRINNVTCVWALLPIYRIESYNDTTEFLKNEKLNKK